MMLCYRNFFDHSNWFSQVIRAHSRPYWKVRTKYELTYMRLGLPMLGGRLTFVKPYTYALLIADHLQSKTTFLIHRAPTLKPEVHKNSTIYLYDCKS